MQRSWEENEHSDFERQRKSGVKNERERESTMEDEVGEVVGALKAVKRNLDFVLPIPLCISMKV